jgi:hypothetical protein
VRPLRTGALHGLLLLGGCLAAAAQQQEKAPQVPVLEDVIAP